MADRQISLRDVRNVVRIAKSNSSKIGAPGATNGLDPEPTVANDSYRVGNLGFYQSALT
jgi:hypothetical protein